MRISTKGRYGIRAMFDLAVNWEMGPVPLGDIAARQKLSEPYLEQLMASLKRAGLVLSVRGAQGGYLLPRAPSEITVGQLLRALEGSIAVTDCTDEDSDGCCDHSDRCVYHSIWNRINSAVQEVIDSITLDDMVKDSQKCGDEQLMYYI